MRPDAESGWQTLYQVRRSIRVVQCVYHRLATNPKILCIPGNCNWTLTSDYCYLWQFLWHLISCDIRLLSFCEGWIHSVGFTSFFMHIDSQAGSIVILPFLIPPCDMININSWYWIACNCYWSVFLKSSKTYDIQTVSVIWPKCRSWQDVTLGNTCSGAD